MTGFTGPMEDRLALRELVDRYGDAVIRRDAEAWTALWTEDASWVIRGRTIAGRDAIAQTWREAMARYAFVSFTCTLAAAAVEGEVAECRVHATEYQVPADGPARWQFGQYEDRMVRTGGGWLFARRAFTPLFVSGP